MKMPGAFPVREVHCAQFFSCRGNPAGPGVTAIGSHNMLPPAWFRCNLYGIIFQIISGAAMHTDEYEISIGREISLCRKLIRRLKSSIQKREKRYGISTEGLLKGLDQERLNETNPDFLKWSRDYRELRNWERMLVQYEEELKKLIADR
jgi:hypothetical protein